jgi:16S rRNA (guanine527-N7)-methyltransferase
MSDQEPSNDLPPSATLAEALTKAQIELPEAQIARLDEYCRKLWEWNEKLNLTRHTDYDKFVLRDVVDSLKVAEQITEGAHVMDIGTGGGVPGVIVAIVRPDVDMTLTESMAKKARVVGDIVHQMQLPAIVHHGRGEDLLTEDYYDFLIVRAVAPLKKLLTWFKPHWGAIGRLLVIKGPAWVDERRDARQAGLMHELNLRKVATWPLPGTNSESVLLAIWPRAEGEAPE